jgi:hypothetical protein
MDVAELDELKDEMED